MPEKKGSPHDHMTNLEAVGSSFDVAMSVPSYCMIQSVRREGKEVGCRGCAADMFRGRA